MRPDSLAVRGPATAADERDGARPLPRPDRSKPRADVVLERTVDVPPEDFQRHILDRPLEWPAWLFLPGVAGTSNLRSGTWGHPGARRRITLTDGSTTLEELTRVSPVRDGKGGFAYTVFAATNPLFRMLVGAAFNEFEFTAVPGSDGRVGTRVKWTYSFQASNRLVAPLLAAYAGLFHRPFMERALDNFQRKAEAARASS